MDRIAGAAGNWDQSWLKPPLAQGRAERSNESTNISGAFPSTWVAVLFCGPAYQSDLRIVNPTRGIPAPGGPLGCYYIVTFFHDAHTKCPLRRVKYSYTWAIGACKFSGHLQSIPQLGVLSLRLVYRLSRTGE